MTDEQYKIAQAIKHKIEDLLDIEENINTYNISERFHNIIIKELKNEHKKLNEEFNNL
jgi:hydrogenase maturation factor HypE